MIRSMTLFQAQGILSTVIEKGKDEPIGFCLFADCDECSLEEVEARIKATRKLLWFGDAFILRSSEKCRHVVVPEVHSLKEALHFCVEMESGHLLDNLRTFELCVLRTSAKNGFKPVFEAVSPGELSVVGRLSFAHLGYLKEHGARMSMYSLEDLQNSVESITVSKHYVTGSSPRSPEVD